MKTEEKYKILISTLLSAGLEASTGIYSHIFKKMGGIEKMGDKILEKGEKKFIEDVEEIANRRLAERYLNEFIVKYDLGPDRS